MFALFRRGQTTKTLVFCYFPEHEILTLLGSALTNQTTVSPTMVGFPESHPNYTFVPEAEQHTKRRLTIELRERTGSVVASASFAVHNETSREVFYDALCARFGLTDAAQRWVFFDHDGDCVAFPFQGYSDGSMFTAQTQPLHSIHGMHSPAQPAHLSAAHAISAPLLPCASSADRTKMQLRSAQQHIEQLERQLAQAERARAAENFERHEPHRRTQDIEQRGAFDLACPAQRRHDDDLASELSATTELHTTPKREQPIKRSCPQSAPAKIGQSKIRKELFDIKSIPGKSSIMFIVSSKKKIR